MSARGFGMSDGDANPCYQIFDLSIDAGQSYPSPTKLRRGQSTRRSDDKFRVGADRRVRPRFRDVRWQIKSRRGLCRGRLPRLPAATDYGPAYTNIQHQSLKPIPREGVAALPYAENSKIDTDNDDGSHLNSKSSRILVRADTAVRPYAEDSKIDTHNDDGSHQNSKSSRSLVREGVAALPYAENS